MQPKSSEFGALGQRYSNTAVGFQSLRAKQCGAKVDAESVSPRARLSGLRMRPPPSA